MTISLRIRSGVSWNYPQNLEEDWGVDASGWAADVTSAINASALASNWLLYDAVVGTTAQFLNGNATHTSLATAITDTSAGGNILIHAGTYTIDSKIVIDKALTIYSEGACILAATVAIASDEMLQISSDNVRLSGITLDADAGTPDYAVSVDVGIEKLRLDVFLEGSFAISSLLNNSNCLSKVSDGGVELSSHNNTISSHAVNTLALNLEDTGAGTNTISLVAPTPVAASVSFKLPATDGLADQVLKTDGNKNLGWTTAALSTTGSNVESISADKTLVAGDYNLQILTPDNNYNINLPSVGITKGRTFRIENTTAYQLIIKSSGGNTIKEINLGFVEVTALQDLPTTAVHWKLLSSVLPTNNIIVGSSNDSVPLNTALLGNITASKGSNTVTFTHATNLVNWNAHTLNNGDTVYFTTTGAVPTGLTALTKYYVVTKATNSFQVASSPSGAARTFSNAGSGTNTVHFGSVKSIYETISTVNYIINGNLDFWQRGTTGTPTSNQFLYVADRFIAFMIGGGVNAVTRQSFPLSEADVSHNPKYFWRSTVTESVGGDVDHASYIEHRIENVNKLSNKTVTLSFWVNSVATENISIEFVQHFGTGGSADVTSLGVVKYPTSSTWQKITHTVTLPSISGKTVGSANDCLRIIIWLDAGSNFNARTDSLGHQTGVFNFAQFMLNEGAYAAPFTRAGITMQGEMNACQRYYEKSYDINVNPATGTAGGYMAFVSRKADQQDRVIAFFKANKYKDPTVTIYNYATGATGTFRNFDKSNELNAASAPAQHSALFRPTANTTEDDRYFFHWTADAEITGATI